MNREFDTKQSEIVVDQFRQFRPEDAPGVTECFRKVYGEDYPIKIFYQPDELIKANRTGEYYTIVARTSAGHVVAVGSLFRSAPYLRLYEAGAGLVLKEFRNLQINKRMWLFVYEEWAPKQSNVEELFREAVFNHTIMQKTVLDFGHIETAIEVALMPAEAYTKEKSATGRVASLLVFRAYMKSSCQALMLINSNSSIPNWTTNVISLIPSQDYPQKKRPGLILPFSALLR
ncbi:MAG: hypothetical protein NTY51_06980 [Deltaproteobacteria bacterium]|nr:hypothetical protein [Deltaproteobacteria bacterium]